MRFWEIKHRLFGCHYVVVRYGSDDFVRRVRWTPTGEPYVMMYDHFIWLRQTQREWQALTFDKSTWLEAQTQPKLRSVV